MGHTHRAALFTTPRTCDRSCTGRSADWTEVRSTHHEVTHHQVHPSTHSVTIRSTHSVIMCWCGGQLAYTQSALARAAAHRQAGRCDGGSVVVAQLLPGVPAYFLGCSSAADEPHMNHQAQRALPGARGGTPGMPAHLSEDLRLVPCVWHARGLGLGHRARAGARARVVAR